MKSPMLKMLKYPGLRTWHADYLSDSWYALSLLIFNVNKVLQIYLLNFDDIGLKSKNCPLC